MKAYRTPWWYFVLGVLFGFVFGAFLVSITESSAISLSGAPWVVLAYKLAFAPDAARVGIYSERWIMGEC